MQPAANWQATRDRRVALGRGGEAGCGMRAIRSHSHAKCVPHMQWYTPSVALPLLGYRLSYSFFTYAAMSLTTDLFSTAATQTCARRVAGCVLVRSLVRRNATRSRALEAHLNRAVLILLAHLALDDLHRVREGSALLFGRRVAHLHQRLSARSTQSRSLSTSTLAPYPRRRAQARERREREGDLLL